MIITAPRYSLLTDISRSCNAQSVTKSRKRGGKGDSLRQANRQADTVLLLALRDAASPIGARQGRISLLADGIDVSEATVGRMLRDFDRRGWTTSVERKGRVLTDEGLRHATLTRDHEHLTRHVSQAIGVETVQDLVNLLYARRTVERETAREAALTATESDVNHLRELLEVYGTFISKDIQSSNARNASMDFHRAIAALASNHFVRAMAELIMTGRLERMGTMLDFIISSTTEGSETVEENYRILEDHRAIVEAIEAGSSLEAECLMQDHLDRFIARAERYIAGTSGELVGRVLKLLDNSTIAEILSVT